MTTRKPSKKKLDDTLHLARILVWARKTNGMRVRDEDKLEQRFRRSCESIEKMVGFDPWDQFMDKAWELGGIRPMPGKNY
jgi:hypothetical protein